MYSSVKFSLRHHVEYRYILPFDTDLCGNETINNTNIELDDSNNTNVVYM